MCKLTCFYVYAYMCKSELIVFSSVGFSHQIPRPLYLELLVDIRATPNFRQGYFPEKKPSI